MRERLVLVALLLLFLGLTWISENWAQGYAIWIATTLALLGYFLVTTAARLHYRERQTPFAPHYRPSVCILVPARNEEVVIEETIREMMKIVYHRTDGKPNYNLIVINDGSTDETPQILDRLAAEYTNLIVHHRPSGRKSSKAMALNDAIAKYCQEDIVCIYDADARVMPNFLERIIPYLSDPKVGAVQAQKLISNPDINFLTGAQTDELLMLMSLSKSQDLIEGAVDLRGNGMLVKLVALQEVGGWNEIALTEDLDMSSRLHTHGWDVRYCPDIPVYEMAVDNWNDLYKQRRRWVEGGVRRYLDHFFSILNPNVTIAKKFDMFIFFGQFALPLWMGVDLLYAAYSAFWLDRPFHITMMMWLISFMMLIFILNTINGIRRLATSNWREVIWRTFRHSVFALHWLPVIFVTALRILFVGQPMEWVKTERRRAGPSPTGT